MPAPTIAPLNTANMTDQIAYIELDMDGSPVSPTH